ncbi:MAG: hypothetical protein RL154_1398 [Pseudomonadota bacterium]|jgi:ferredoxin
MTTRVELVNDFLAINAGFGSTLQDVVEKAGSGLPFGCRDGECGTCVVEVLAGMEFLNEKTEKEIKVLAAVEAIDLKPNMRLACQLKIAQLNGLVRIKY